jgi:thioredoxin reductase (NADPH)
MANSEETKSERAVMEQLQAQLKPIFKNLSHELPLLLFTRPGKNDPFSQATRFIIRAVREVSSKITLREFDLSHDQAKKWKVQHAPTLLLDPEHYHVRWLGPDRRGDETFVEALLMMGRRKTDLSEDARKVLMKIDSPRQIKVFVSPSPLLSTTGGQCLKAAIEGLKRLP